MRGHEVSEAFLVVQAGACSRRYTALARAFMLNNGQDSLHFRYFENTSEGTAEM